MPTYGSLDKEQKEVIKEKIKKIYNLTNYDNELKRQLFKETGITISQKTLSKIIWDIWIGMHLQGLPFTRGGKQVIF